MTPLAASDFVDRSCVLARGDQLARAQRGVFLRRKTQARELVGDLARGRFADRNGLRQMIEIAGGEIAQLGQDQDIGGLERRQRKLNVLLGQDIDDLAADTEDRIQLLARCQRRPEIHRDDHVRPHGPRDVDRQVVGEAAVH
jgi:hypothetical protein